MILLQEGLTYLASEPLFLLYMIFGVFFGIVFGCIPGLTAVLGVTLLIPFTYSMGPAAGLSILIGVYVGGISGGLITATLINIPGTPSSITTCWDGYPMTKKGKPETALSLGVYASVIGGLFSAFALIIIAPQLSKVTLMFGSWEYTFIIVLAMAIVISMVSSDGAKGCLSAVLGLVLGSVGMDTLTGVSRLTFGTWQLKAGIPIAALLMGLFAISEILSQVGDINGAKVEMNINKIPFIPEKEERKGTGKSLLLGSVIGTAIGVLPGIGQNVATLISYNQAKVLSKNPELFGHGSPEGICASESSNNATNGGALVPLITLGIPGDTVTAALIGGLMIHGVQPGPLMVKNHPDIMGCIMIVYFMANIVMYVMESGMMRTFVKIVKIRKSFLYPAIIVCCIIGAYATNNRLFDVFVLLIFGIFGYVMIHIFKMDVVPILLGYILGPLFESNLRKALIAENGNFATITEHPIAMISLLVSIMVVLWTARKHLKERDAQS